MTTNQISSPDAAMTLPFHAACQRRGAREFIRWTYLCMRTIYMLVVSALICVGCGRPNDPMKVNIQAPTLPDPQMDEAIAKARDSMTNFLAALHSPRTNQYGFSISARFESKAKRIQEDIWVTNLRYNNSNALDGIVALDKTEVGLAFKQPVTIAVSNVVDWMYVEDGRVVGAFTGRLLRSRMSERERQQYDAGLNYRFE